MERYNKIIANVDLMDTKNKDVYRTCFAEFYSVMIEENFSSKEICEAFGVIFNINKNKFYRTLSQLRAKGYISDTYKDARRRQNNRALNQNVKNIKNSHFTQLKIMEINDAKHVIVSTFKILYATRILMIK